MLKIIRTLKRAVLLTFVLGLFQTTFAQELETPSPVIFIYDASGSMWGQIGGKSKIEIASEVLSSSVLALPDVQKVGLVAYGHRAEGDCQDVEVLVDVATGTKSQVVAALKGIRPLGKTPLAYSALQVIEVLRETGLKATIILITDGIESCDGNLCDVIRAAREEGIDFRLHIIGFGLGSAETQPLVCAATAGDGQYFDAADADGLQEVLLAATSAPVDKIPGNVSVYAVKNGISVDALAEFYHAGTKDKVAALRTYRDTVAVFLPPGTYDMTVRALENSDVSAVSVSGITSLPDQVVHRTVSFDGGKILPFASNNGEGWDAVVNVFSRATGQSVAGTRTYGRTPTIEIDPGEYDVEFRALVMKGLETVYKVEGVSVAGGDSKEVSHDFKTGIAKIGARVGSELIDATVQFKEVSSGKPVAGSRTYTAASSNPSTFILNPGTYEVTVNALAAHAGKRDVFTITVETGKTVEKIVDF